ncbi:MAG: ECF-type sigma factor [Gemmataceae bacterium]|nr:ECF-type sigma factor [Gemmataceae bacterium]MCI0740258.1 ECF-type sigma factor [Gemmataceae bacterium]
MADVTRILESAAQGDAQAAAQLLPLVYDELRRLAAQKLASENPGHTLEATALVHEAYMRLVASEERESTRNATPGFANRHHFFAAAAEAMRRILVENARRRKRLKRGGDMARHELVEDQLALPEPREDLEALDEALEELAKEDAPKAELVKLRYFAGLSEEDAAVCLGISRATAARWWAYARAWLFDRLRQ